MISFDRIFNAFRGTANPLPPLRKTPSLRNDAISPWRVVNEPYPQTGNPAEWRNYRGLSLSLLPVGSMIYFEQPSDRWLVNYLIMKAPGDDIYMWFSHRNGCFAGPAEALRSGRFTGRERGTRSGCLVSGDVILFPYFRHWGEYGALLPHDLLSKGTGYEACSFDRFYVRRNVP